jgi:hypothetical protein
MLRFTTATWKAPSQKERKYMSSDCFLDPQRRKYPVRYNANGPIYVHAVRTAIAYSAKYNDKKVYTLAKQLYALYKYAITGDKATLRKELQYAS